VTSPIYHKVISDMSAADFDKLIELLDHLYSNLDGA